MELALCSLPDRLGIDDRVVDIEPVNQQDVVSVSIIANKTV